MVSEVRESILTRDFRGDADMTTETTTGPTTNAADAPQPTRDAKTASVTLTAGDSIMRILATRHGDGSASTFVTTTDGSKKTTRGMTEEHTSMAAARTAMSRLVKDAEGLGWRRRAGRG